MSRNVTSIIAGTPVEGATGVRITSTNPARTSEIVADVSLGDASTFVAATQAARLRRSAGWRR
jgi:acyl-CoA reductase-like NAD-dependent aldehyde dehydrogenase